MTGASGPMSERAGCLIAWLILLLIVLALGSVVYFYIGMVLEGQGGGQGQFPIILAVAFSIGAAGSAALLSGRRYGFWMIAAAFVFAALLQVLAAGRLDIALAGLFNVGVIRWLLRPVWRRLE